MKIEKSSEIMQIGYLDETDIYDLFLGFIKRNNFDYFSIFHVPEPKYKKISDILVLSNWPDYLIRRHDELKMLQHFPLMDSMKVQDEPLACEINLECFNELRSDEQQFLKLFSDSGFRFSIGNQVQSETGKMGFVVYSASSEPNRKLDIDALQEFSGCMFRKVSNIKQGISEGMTNLSKRERECLSWTSEGKTSYEIGKILGLSENTINNYLVAVGRKLRAVNRPHMVSIALREGII